MVIGYCGHSERLPIAKFRALPAFPTCNLRVLPMRATDSHARGRDNQCQPSPLMWVFLPPGSEKVQGVSPHLLGLAEKSQDLLGLCGLTLNLPDTRPNRRHFQEVPADPDKQLSHFLRLRVRKNDRWQYCVTGRPLVRKKTSALRSVTVAGGAVEAPGARPEYGRPPAYHGRGTRDARGSGDQVRSRHLCGKVPSTTREQHSADRAQKNCRCTGAHTRSHALYICSYGGGSVHGNVWG